MDNKQRYMPVILEMCTYTVYLYINSCDIPEKLILTLLKISVKFDNVCDIAFFFFLVYTIELARGSP